MTNQTLTIERLLEMAPHETIASGEIIDNPEGINMTNSGKLLKWIAKRGGIHDWAIYCHWAYHDWLFIEDQGDKVTSDTNILKLVPATDEALAMYRL